MMVNDAVSGISHPGWKLVFRADPSKGDVGWISVCKARIGNVESVKFANQKLTFATDGMVDIAVGQNSNFC